MASFSWKKLKNAQVFGRGNYLLPGEYKLKLLKMYTIQTRKKGDALIVDFEVLESDNEKVPVGGKRNWYQGLADEEVAFPAIKEFLQALFAVDLEDDEEVEDFEEGLAELMEKCADEAWQNRPDDKHPMNGKTVGVTCFMKQTKQDKEFTVHQWAPWSEE